MSNNVTKNAADAFAILVDEGSASNENLINMGLAIGYSVEELNELYSSLYEDEDDDEDSAQEEEEEETV